MMTMADIRHVLTELIVPLRNQVANTVSRAVVNLVNNAASMQQVQVDAVETIEDVEHFQPYGYSSVPAPGAEAVIVCSGGDRAQAMAVVVTDQGARPTDQVEGEVAVFHRDGHRINLRANGDIEIQCGAGQKIFLNDGAGGDALATKNDVQRVRDDLHEHDHAYIKPLHPDPVPGKTTSNPSVTAPVGTTVVRGK